MVNIQMSDIRKDKNFYYSQNSLKAFLECPLKFKYKYIDGIFLEKENQDIKEAFDEGRKFHLIAERYFNNIPTGVEYENEKMKFFFEKFKEKFKKNKNSEYLTEYTIRDYRETEIRIYGRYDLLILEDESIEIWDWKSYRNEQKKEHFEKNFQTIIYMYLAFEILPLMYKKEISADKITMGYWNPNFPDEEIKINYNHIKHEENKEKLIRIIQEINGYDFTNIDKIKNRSCIHCEFNYLCNE